MIRSRRHFLASVAWAATAGRRAWGRTTFTPLPPHWLPAPILSDDRVLRFVAGVRPFRRSGPRLERQERGGKVVVHNYGHGGAGYTLSWGSALAAFELLRGAVASGGHVAVLGAGVVGLSTARILQERGLRVRVYAREVPPGTTSDLAGAEWSPDIVDRGETAAARHRFERMLVSSWRRFHGLIGAGWGVSARPIYEAEDVASGLDDLPAGLVPAPRRLAALPFAPARAGRVYQTMLIEAPIYMARLMEEVRRAGGQVERREFAEPAALESLPARAIVNCLGLGAGAVFDDPAMVPIRGQLVHLRPQELPYLLDHPEGYMVPRADALVLGGTFEVGVAEARADPAACARILAANRRFFAPP